MSPLNLLSLLGAGSYNWLFPSESTVMVALAEVRFDSEVQAASFEKKATKVEFLTEVFNKDVLKAHFTWSLLKNCS